MSMPSGANEGLTERIGGTSICWMPFFAWICAFILAAAAAAAAAALFLVLAAEGLSVASRVKGLRARCDSDSRREGERERRSVSKRERAGRSAGSSSSKRERGRRSSDMLRGGCARVEVVQSKDV
jgi:hypothetical protein